MFRFSRIVRKVVPGLLSLCLGYAGMHTTPLVIQNVQAEEAPAPGQGPVLKKGDRLAIIGDSITEQKMYSRFMEQYILACRPDLEVHCLQFGWGGETAGGFRGRMENDLIPFKPNVATTCYGMNDGGYRAWEDGIGKGYSANMVAILDRVKKEGGVVVVGSPGAVDTKYFRGGAKMAEVYNDNLNHLKELDQELAKKYGWPFANVHDVMMTSMAKAKAAYGDDYSVCGGDGVHPPADGHLLMAYAFLKGLGFDGNLATFTVDMKGKAEASEGHKILTAENGKVEIESSRYPFCFFGGEKDANGTRSMLPYVPFNEDLNRFMLVVKNLDGEKFKVTWGNASKSFAKADLEKGINLAAEFIDNPFSEPFKKVGDTIQQKQNFETDMIKGKITHIPGFLRGLEGEKDVVDALESVRKKLMEKQIKMATDARASVVPVKHTLTIVKE